MVTYRVVTYRVVTIFRGHTEWSHRVVTYREVTKSGHIEWST